MHACMYAGLSLYVYLSLSFCLPGWLAVQKPVYRIAPENRAPGTLTVRAEAPLNPKS